MNEQASELKTIIYIFTSSAKAKIYQAFWRISRNLVTMMNANPEISTKNYYLNVKWISNVIILSLVFHLVLNLEKKKTAATKRVVQAPNRLNRKIEKNVHYFSSRIHEMRRADSAAEKHITNNWQRLRIAGLEGNCNMVNGIKLELMWFKAECLLFSLVSNFINNVFLTSFMFINFAFLRRRLIFFFARRSYHKH